MIDPVVLLAFVPAALALNLTPGADMMFCLGQGLRGGPRAALAADVGIAAGCMVHVLLAGIGLGAAVAAAPWLFEAIRWIGVAYLLILAVQTLRAGPVVRDVPPVRPSRAFREALVVNLTNPKVILFVLAFLPQFVDPARPVLPQFLILGAVLSLGGLVINGLVGVFAGGAGRRLARSATAARWLGRISAAVFVGLAVRLALMQRS
ncbi:LysE family translocator [Anianabacter salinae]|uniref:LysE family translocator n=1 Tax=Anianabacter salinae TaxID=2851023 RepID=UPI00225E0D56|nr:LysE family translocator [Anianabacter salinae]MBV0910843.1 LysE family translocator [Anianabacter salinae]